jgi:hypothetical protein
LDNCRRLRPKQAIQQTTPLNISVRFTNTGDTPAKNVTSDIAVEVVKKDSPPSFMYPQPHTRNFIGILSPGQYVDVPTGIHGEPEALTPAQFADFGSGKVYIAIYQRTTYVDAFGIDR